LKWSYVACLGHALAGQPGQESGIKRDFHLQFDLSSSSSSSSFVQVILPFSYSHKQIPKMVSLRSRLVEAPVATLKTSTVDHFAHESDDSEPRSAKQPGSDELSEHTQLMTPADTDVSSLLDVALASSGAVEVAQGLGADIDADQGELNGPVIEEAEEGRDRLSAASDMTDASPAAFSGDIVDDGTANSENEANAHQFVLQLGSTEIALSSVEPPSAQLKRKRNIETWTGRNPGMLSINPIT